MSSGTGGAKDPEAMFGKRGDAELVLEVTGIDESGVVVRSRITLRRS